MLPVFWKNPEVLPVDPIEEIVGIDLSIYLYSYR